MPILHYLESLLHHLAKILNTAYGWLVAALIFIGNFFAPACYPFIVVGILVLIDLGWGVAVAFKKGEFFLSEALRDTCIKVAIYASCLASVYLLEQMFYTGIVATSIASALAGTCEVFSFSASILIIKPKFPFISLFREQLRGEMEKKLGRPLNELNNF